MHATISEATPLVPEVIAEDVVSRRMHHRASRIESALAERSEIHFATNETFHRRLMGRFSRETLESYMEKWLDASLKTGTPILH